MKTGEPTSGPRPHAHDRCRITGTRRLAFWAAVVACIPYLAIKTNWLLGGELGIPPGSMLLDRGRAPAMMAANAGSLALDATVVVLALALSRGWATRVPAWLLAGSLWVATGLLGPILVGFPAQFVMGLFLGPVDTSSADPFLDPWVFNVVYGGFIVQALALGTLAILHARDRWGHLWWGRMADLPDGGAGPALRVIAVACVAVLALPLLERISWVTGLGGDDLTRDGMLAQAGHVPFAVAALVGVMILGLARSSRVRLLPVLGALWVGSSAMTCWSAWVLVSTGASSDAATDYPASTPLVLAFHLAVGIAITAVGAIQLSIRASTPSTPSTQSPTSTPDYGPLRD